VRSVRQGKWKIFEGEEPRNVPHVHPLQKEGKRAATCNVVPAGPTGREKKKKSTPKVKVSGKGVHAFGEEKGGGRRRGRLSLTRLNQKSYS